MLYIYLDPLVEPNNMGWPWRLFDGLQKDFSTGGNLCYSGAIPR
jgi:hypothetical protein